MSIKKHQWYITLNQSLLAGVLICGANVVLAEEGTLYFPETTEEIVEALTKSTKPTMQSLQKRSRSFGPSTSYDDIPSDIPPKIGAMVNFNFGSAEIRQDSYPLLRSFGKALESKELERAIIEIEGHTDSIGHGPNNWKLSKKRAQAVKDFLVYFYTLDPRRLIVVPKGEDEPIASNYTREGRARNRRVVFVRID